MKKRNIVILTLLISIIILFIYPGKLFAAQKYYLHSLVQQTMTPDIEKAINLWVDFLYEENDSLRKTYWSQDEVERFGDDYCLFCTSFFYQWGRAITLNRLLPYIIYVEEKDSVFIITTMFMEKSFALSDSSLKNQSPWGIIKVVVEKNNNSFALKNDLSEEARFWYRFEAGNINYYVEPTVKIDTAVCYEANNYVNYISNLWYGKDYINKIEYYVAPTSAAVNKLVGFEFGFLGGIGEGYTLINAKAILSGNKNFNYKHELTHLILPEIPNQLLSEGLATYFGGTGDLDFETAVKKFSVKNYPLNDEKIKDILDYPVFFEFYVFSALACEQVYKSKGIDGLRELSKNIIKTEGEDFHKENKIMLERICNMLGVGESELIERVNNRIKSFK